MSITQNFWLLLLPSIHYIFEGCFSTPDICQRLINLSFVCDDALTLDEYPSIQQQANKLFLKYPNKRDTGALSLLNVVLMPCPASYILVHSKIFFN